MPFNHSILISLQDKVTKNLNKINKKLILISKTAKKSTDKINKSLKKLKLKQTFELNIRKALKSLRKLKDKIKDIGRTLKNKIKMPKLSGLIGGIGGFLGMRSVLTEGLSRERATKEWKKVKPAKISEIGAKQLKLQAEGKGAWNSKFPLLGSFEDTRATQTEVAKLGVGEKQILSMTKTAMIAKMAWNTPVKFFINSMGKIFDVFRINRKDFSKNAKVIGNQIDYIADKTGNVIHKDVVDVLTRTSGSLRLLGFKMRKSIGVASWASTTATHPELAASGFNAFVRELTTQMNVDKLGYNPGYKEYIQQATSGKDRANRLGNLIEHLQKLTPDTLYKLFTKQTAGWLIQIKGATEKLRDISKTQDDKDSETALNRALKIELSGLSGRLARTQKEFKNILTLIYNLLKGPLTKALGLISKGLSWLTKNPLIFKNILTTLSLMLGALLAKAGLTKLGIGGKLASMIPFAPLVYEVMNMAAPKLVKKAGDYFKETINRFRNPESWQDWWTKEYRAEYYKKNPGRVKAVEKIRWITKMQKNEGIGEIKKRYPGYYQKKLDSGDSRYVRYDANNRHKPGGDDSIYKNTIALNNLADTIESSNLKLKTAQ